MSSEALQQPSTQAPPEPPPPPPPRGRVPEPWERRNDHVLIAVIAFVCVSITAHVVGFGGLSIYVAMKREARPINKPVELVMFEVEPPKPPPPPPPKEEPPPPPPPKKIKPPPVKVAKPVTPPPEPPPDAPPPPNEEAPQEPAKPVPLVVGITMSSTSSAGGFAAPVGNTSYGKVENKAVDPSQVQQYRAPKYVPSYQVDRQPELVNEVKIPYPLEAKRADVEGSVVLSIKIDEKGDVISVKVLDGPGYGLNEAAAAAVRRFKWRPATKGGEVVATEIKYTYTFYLD